MKTEHFNAHKAKNILQAREEQPMQMKVGVPTQELPFDLRTEELVRADIIAENNLKRRDALFEKARFNK